jgi:hypothetical protein
MNPTKYEKIEKIVKTHDKAYYFNKVSDSIYQGFDGTRNSKDRNDLKKIISDIVDLI